MILPMNDLGQWTVGQLSPNWEIPLVRDTRIFDLTGVSTGQMSLIIYNASKVQTGTGAGTFAIKNVKPGVVTYTQAAAEMAAAGTFYFRIKVNFNGTTPDYSDLIKIVINA